MTGHDWDAEARLCERDDAGSELQYNFTLIATGTLREMVGRVLAMDSDRRARVVIEVAGGKSLNIGEILALSAEEGLA